MRDNSTQITQPNDIKSIHLRNEIAQSAFHFEIDGHDFIALDRENWRVTQCHDVLGATSANEVLGEIATSAGGYVIIADTQAAGSAPEISELLSRRELQVAYLIADGRCDKEIARQLTISIYTVREHIRRIFAKLNVCRRGGIIVKLLKQKR